MKRTILAGLVAALALGLIGAPVAAEDGTATYEAPYDEGPTGGDGLAYTSADEDGQVTIARVNPAPGPLNCPGGGAFAKYEVGHDLTGPVENIRLEFTDAVVDSFVFVLVSARDEDGEWLGSAQQRGPLFRDGELELALDPELFDEEEGLWVGDVITIQFGLEMASACPHANAGTARFTQLTVS